MSLVGNGYDTDDGAYHQPPSAMSGANYTHGVAYHQPPDANSNVYYVNGVPYQQPLAGNANYVTSVRYHQPPAVDNNVNYVNSVPYHLHQQQLYDPDTNAYYASNAQVSVPSRYAMV